MSYATSTLEGLTEEGATAPSKYKPQSRQKKKRKRQDARASSRVRSGCSAESRSRPRCWRDRARKEASQRRAHGRWRPGRRTPRTTKLRRSEYDGASDGPGDGTSRPRPGHPGPRTTPTRTVKPAPKQTRPPFIFEAALPSLVLPPARCFCRVGKLVI